MRSIIRALMAYVQPLGFPCYLKDCVPQGAAFPYITMDVTLPLTPHAEGQLALTLWAAGPYANSHRLAQGDRLLTYFPARGLRLLCTDGAILLRQKGSAICRREEAAQGVQLTYALRFYPET